MTPNRTKPSEAPPSQGDTSPYNPAELPVEPDLGPVPPLSHPEEPGVVKPAI